MSTTYDVTLTRTHKVRVRVDASVINDDEDPEDAACDIAREHVDLSRWKDRAEEIVVDEDWEVVEVTGETAGA